MKVFALIPARGGSKGVPGKNKRLLAGKPVITYTIEAAKASKVLTTIAVSSDDAEILQIAQEAGVRAIVRPPALASDNAPMVPVIEHAIETCQAQAYDVFALLQPTSPLRTARHIDEALSLLDAHPEADGVLAVERITHPHPAKFKKVDEDGYLTEYLLSEDEHMNRQDFPAAFVRNGALFIVRMPYFLREHTIKRGRMVPYEMSQQDSIDINEPLDMLLVETVLREKGKR